MDVILLEKIRNLGDLGDKVSVRSGYGRNYLVPQGKAVPATDESIAMFEGQRAEFEGKAQVKLDEAKVRATALEQLKVVIQAHASDEGKLYGSVGPLEVAKAVVEAGQALEKQEIIMPQGAIHSIGQFKIDVQLHSDVTSSIDIEIEPTK